MVYLLAYTFSCMWYLDLWIAVYVSKNLIDQTPIAAVIITFLHTLIALALIWFLNSLYIAIRGLFGL